MQRAAAPSSDTQMENRSAVLTAATVFRRPMASPSSQPSGTPSSNGSGATAASNGATTHAPDSEPVASRNHAIPLPSRVGRPESTPTGSCVTWRRCPARRSHA